MFKGFLIIIKKNRKYIYFQEKEIKLQFGRY